MRLENRILKRLYEEQERTPPNSWKGYLPYSIIYKKVCGCFSIPKEELRAILQHLEDFGFIERAGYIGIKLNFEVITDA